MVISQAGVEILGKYSVYTKGKIKRYRMMK
jgi:hypothetical protein